MKEKIKKRDIRNKIILYLVILVVIFPVLIFGMTMVAMHLGRELVWFFFVFFMGFAYYAVRQLEKYLKEKNKKDQIILREDLIKEEELWKNTERSSKH
jgi:positive regulator of sigma E activity